VSGQPLIDLQALSKRYGAGEGEVLALDQVSLKIERGEFVAIMGPSGSGKSTLMNILGCLDRPTEGTYCLDGVDVGSLDKAQLALLRNRQLGFVFQAYNLLGRTSALQNVMLPMLYDRDHTRTPEERQALARTMLELVGLSDRGHHQPHELSGGQQQRVAIARALVNDPSLVLADEPTGNLDSKSGQEIMALLHGLHAAGRTIVMVTHEADLAARADRILHMRDGRVEADVMNGSSLKKMGAEVAA
jgi:putative ABC transport system ATP-binding protein